MLETASCSVASGCYRDLRGVQWRIGLGILPSSPSIDDLRRVTANYRRRYAALRKQLLVDPHVPKDGGTSPDVVMDNPLSQNPDSMWGRFFRNAELERMVDQDLTRLYPERGSYFQTSGCQSMLRRILLLWCLSHPEYGYRQGMHELLAPLLYVLNVDVEHLSEVRKAHEDHFADIFDGFSYHENDSTYRLDFKKFSESPGDGSELDKSSTKANSLTELDPATQTIVLLSDAYGAESELGIVLSEKFMEHDAYSMFDALMSGAGGVVAMAEFFSPSPYGSTHSGFTPIIEASSAMYHLLSVVDSSLHNHLVELGVEPQYFSLRWLRVLFGREFSLEDLLIIWDEIFACDNSKFMKANDSDSESNFGVLNSSRGAFISAFAVSMILNLRSSLLATEIATSCLQRLLNFPDDVNLAKLIAKAKSLQALAVEVNNSNSLHVHPGLHDGRKQANTRGHTHTLSLDSSISNVVSESYWEEKWRVLHKEEEEQKQEKVPRIRKSWSQRVRLRLPRTESDPPPSTNDDITKSPQASLKDAGDKNFNNMLSAGRSEETSPNFSDPPSPIHVSKDKSESSSVASNSSVYEDDVESRGTSQESSPLRLPLPPLPVESRGASQERSPLRLPLPHPYDLSSKCTHNDDSTGKSVIGTAERKSLPRKLQWLRKFGRNANEGTSERSSASGEAKVCGQALDSSSCSSSKGEIVDQTTMVNLRNLGQTMLENIQVIEEALLQQDRGQVGPSENSSKNGFVGKEGQVTALSALKELRKISGLLSQM